MTDQKDKISKYEKYDAPQIIKDVGFDFDWDSKKVWALDEPTEEIDINELIWHFDIPFWEKEGTDEYNLKAWDVIKHPEIEKTHFAKVQAADLILIIEQDGMPIGETDMGDPKSRSAQVEFCLSGGRSRRTREALYELIQAMKEDNTENPIEVETIGEGEE